MSTKNTQSTQPAETPKVTRLKFTDTNANSFSDKVLRWELLETKVAPLLDAMPHVKPVHAELVQLLARAKALEFQVKGQKAAATQSSIDRQDIVKKGDALRSRLGMALGFEHGPTSVLLTEFGLRPRRAGGRKKKATPPPTPDPAPQPAPAVKSEAAATTKQK